MSNNLPTFGNGKICYIVVPARDIDEAAKFYETVFNWSISKREDGSTTFDDGVGQVSGTWVLGMQPANSTTSLSVHIMIDDINATIQLIIENRGKIVQPVGKDLPEITALFSDPTGNVLGLYQHVG